MGVPAFYRWLSEKYPKIVQDMLERRGRVVDGQEVPLDLSAENPNGIEYDNLYIDLNGLIHPCSHPEDREAPATEAEMYENVTKYIDRLFAACRPRRLLFLAIDGVAPRAKMNQQRARRFRAAQEAREREEMLAEVVEEMTSLGLSPPPSSGRAWDSNVITPGTEFMSRLSLFLWYYVLDRMNRIPAWRNIKVILSDASEPGEGEHKIMRFIRAQRSQPGYDPNQRHILHGLDADLIMLALATHELHFTILREEVTFGKNKEKVKSDAQRMLDLESAAISALRPQDEWVYAKPLQCLHVSILREYLMYEFQALKDTLPFEFDIERIIDDFVFVCFFVGNDFLPHLPSLDIRDGALDFLIEVYKDMLPSMGEFVTSPGGNVNLRQLDVLLSKVGEVEDQVFQTRKAAEDREQQKRNRQSQYSKMQSGKNVREQFMAQGDLRSQLTALPRKDSRGRSVDVDKKSEAENANAAAKLKGLLQQSKSEAVSSVEVDDDAAVDELELETPEPMKDNLKRKNVDIEITETVDKKRKLAESSYASMSSKPVDKVALANAVKSKLKEKEQKIIEKNKDTVVDTVKFHEYGWKARYYEDNFKKEDIAAGGGLKRMCLTYIEGLCWVLKYYYQGCPSWNWYYPFHYAPFASDLVNVDTYNVSFELSKPFKPVEQLLAVLPAASVAALPVGCQWLMLDEQSPIKDLYSDDIPIDPNGKILPWLWVVLLPFIDENRITAAMDLCLDDLTEDEVKRNTHGKPMIFVHRDHQLAVAVTDKVTDVVATTSFSPVEGHGIQGHLALQGDDQLQAPFERTIPAPARPIGAFSDIVSNAVMCYRYEYPEELEHRSSVMEGAVPAQATLSDFDGMARRPPRLNKGGFNIIDMALNMKRKQQSQNGSYAHHAPNHTFFESKAQREYNRRSDGGYADDSTYNYNSSYNSSSYSYNRGSYSQGNMAGRGKGSGKGGRSLGFSGSSSGGKGYHDRPPPRHYDYDRPPRRGDAPSHGYSSKAPHPQNGSSFSHNAAMRGGYNYQSSGGNGSRGYPQPPPSRSEYFSQPPPSFMQSAPRGFRPPAPGTAQHMRTNPIQQTYSQQREALSGSYSSRPPPHQENRADRFGKGGQQPRPMSHANHGGASRDPRRRKLNM